jgi:hypothetical protein
LMLEYTQRERERENMHVIVFIKQYLNKKNWYHVFSFLFSSIETFCILKKTIESLEIPFDGLTQSGSEIFTYLTTAHITRESHSTVLEKIDKIISFLFGNGNDLNTIFLSLRFSL